MVSIPGCRWSPPTPWEIAATTLHFLKLHTPVHSLPYPPVSRLFWHLKVLPPTPASGESTGSGSRLMLGEGTSRRVADKLVWKCGRGPTGTMRHRLQTTPVIRRPAGRLAGRESWSFQRPRRGEHPVTGEVNKQSGIWSDGACVLNGQSQALTDCRIWVLLPRDTRHPSPEGSCCSTKQSVH